VKFETWEDRFRDDPYAEYARMRSKARVHRFGHVDGSTSWLLARYEDVRNALGDHRFSKAQDDRHLLARLSAELVKQGIAPDLQAAGEELRRAGIVGPGNVVTRTLFDSDPPDHTRLRRLVSKAFTPRRVEEHMRSRIQEITDRLLDGIASGPGEGVDLVPALAVPLPVTVICELLGVPVEDRGLFQAWFMPVAALDGQQQGWEEEAQRYFSRLIATRRPEVRLDLPDDEQPDLVSVLIAARDEGGALTEQQLVLTLTLLLRAGHETMVQLIAGGMLALLQHPDQMRLLRERPELGQQAVEELLRYTSPIQQSSLRYAREDIEIGDVVIPASDRIRAGIASANRDPGRFEQPDRLDITRTGNHHLALGHGTHFCLGASLARQEAQIVFGTLLRRFPEITLACSPGDLRWRPYGTMRRGLATLPVRLGRPDGSDVPLI
jgi:cytochrome P450